jgi:dolichyl-phosphate-mannose-protein mannosyltransferase
MWKIAEQKYWLILAAICLFAFGARIFRLGEIKSYTFDEVYHAVTAKLIHRNDPQAYEWWNPPVEPDTAVDWLHPPLAKYTQAFAMIFFGETPFGWRISAVVFGTAVIFVTAEFTRYLFNDRRLALLAALLASFDGLLLTQSRIAMNDIHVTFAILMTFWVYAWYRKTLQKLITHPQQKNQLLGTLRLSMFLSGMTAGLAMGTKWSGLFGLVVLWVFELSFLIFNLRAIAPKKIDAFKEIVLRVGIFIILPFVMYVLSYSHMFLQGKTLVCNQQYAEEGKCYCNQESSMWVDWMKTIAGGDPARWEALEARGGCKRLISHFSELHKQIWWYQTTLKATHGYQSRPLDWFLNLRPVWFYVSYQNDKIANIYAQGNPALFWFGDIAALGSLVFLSIQAAKTISTPLKTKSRKLGQKLHYFVSTMTDIDTNLGKLFYLTVTYFAVWLPWEASPRIMFFYHYTPAVPLLAILLAYWLLRLAEIRKVRALAAGVVITIGLTFLIFYPNWTGLPVSKQFAEIFYFALNSWR